MSKFHLVAIAAVFVLGLFVMQNAADAQEPPALLYADGALYAVNAAGDDIRIADEPICATDTPITVLPEYNERGLILLTLGDGNARSFALCDIASGEVQTSLESQNSESIFRSEAVLSPDGAAFAYVEVTILDRVLGNNPRALIIADATDGSEIERLELTTSQVDRFKLPRLFWLADRIVIFETRFDNIIGFDVQRLLSYEVETSESGLGFVEGVNADGDRFVEIPGSTTAQDLSQFLLADERIAVISTDGRTDVFDLVEGEQLVFESPEAVALQRGTRSASFTLESSIRGGTRIVWTLDGAAIPHLGPASTVGFLPDSRFLALDANGASAYAADSLEPASITGPDVDYSGARWVLPRMWVLADG